MKVKELIAVLEADGWFLVRTKGSHRQFHHPTKTRYRNRVGQAERGSASWNLEQRVTAGGSEKVRPQMDYVVIIEKGEHSYGAYVPDLPGCVAVGETREETIDLIREAIAFHLEGLRQDGLQVPPPVSSLELVRVDA